MRHHARAVILLGGWLLMTPPWKPAPWNEAASETDKASSQTLTPQQRTLLKDVAPAMPDDSAPITKWLQITAFDTAKECETERAKLLLKVGKAVEPLQLNELPAGVPDANMGWYLARCVPSESVYPPKPSAQK